MLLLMEKTFGHAEGNIISKADDAVHVVGVSVNYFWLLVVY